MTFESHSLGSKFDSEGLEWGRDWDGLPRDKDSPGLRVETARAAGGGPSPGPGPSGRPGQVVTVTVGNCDCHGHGGQPEH